MSNTLKKSHRPNYQFIFSTPAKAEQFFDIARRRQDTHIVQYPLSSDGSGKRLLNHVLVTGTGSVLFDINMRNELTAKAHELGGYLMPQV